MRKSTESPVESLNDRMDQRKHRLSEHLQQSNKDEEQTGRHQGEFQDMYNSPKRPKSINKDCRGQRYILKAMKIFSKRILTENVPQLRNKMLIQIQEKLMTLR